MAKDGAGVDTPRGAEMRRIFERWERSGLTLGEFARREGLVLPTLYWWRRRLSSDRIQSDRRRRTKSASKSGKGSGTRQPKVSFTEVTGRLGLSTGAGTGFEVVLNGGTTVRVPEGFDALSLRRLLETLGGC
jgi:hypothetical protein